VIWMLAAIGSLIGLALYSGALVLALLTVALLAGVTLLESVFNRLRTGAYANDDESS